jgi:hypothetical protein
MEFLSNGAFTSDEERVTYMGSYLAEGAPKAWFTVIRKHSPELLDDFAGFTTSSRRTLEIQIT